MAKQRFVNLSVRDLPKAKAFYKAIGGVANPQFTDDTAPAWCCPTRST